MIAKTKKMKTKEKNELNFDKTILFNLGLLQIFKLKRKR